MPGAQCANAVDVSEDVQGYSLRGVVALVEAGKGEDTVNGLGAIVVGASSRCACAAAIASRRASKKDIVSFSWGGESALMVRCHMTAEKISRTRATLRSALTDKEHSSQHASLPSLAYPYMSPRTLKSLCNPSPLARLILWREA